jgi:hypothetical protein
MTVAQPGSARRICVRCGADVSQTKRIKDTAGQYYCQSCYSANSSVGPGKAASAASAASDQRFGLVKQVTCPHCWNQFPPRRILWVSQHSDLIGDPVLGPEKPRRFLPSRYTPGGDAIDLRGTTCQSLACPRCHLHIPRALLEMEPLLASIVGGPKSGKSYFLSAMTWELRKRSAADFALVFNDADTVSNQLLNENEATLFLSDDPDQPVAISKTELEGDLYDQVVLDGRVVNFPRPFLFNLRPAGHHPNAAQSLKIGRLLCMYDNAGEHFQPGMDGNAAAATQHLAKSKILMFLFDPTQDPRFRTQCRSLSQDPQLVSARGTQRQETLLIEAGLRIRRFAGLAPNIKHDAPLLIVVSKSDVWAPLIDEEIHSDPTVASPGTKGIKPLDIPRIERVSAKLRELLMQWTPEVVTAAEDFSKYVVYIPVSSLGCSPELAPIGDGSTSGLFVKPKNIAPRWVTVPILYAFAKWTTGLVANNLYVLRLPAQGAP